MNDADEIVHEVLVEGHEHLDQLDRDLVALEQDQDSRALIGSIFRTIGRARPCRRRQATGGLIDLRTRLALARRAHGVQPTHMVDVTDFDCRGERLRVSVWRPGS